MKNKINLRPLLRAMYMRSPFLRSCWQKFQQVKYLTIPILTFWKNHKSNRLALQELANRRFQIQPELISESAIQHADWPVIDISAVAYNSEKWIAKFFATLIAQAYPFAKIKLLIVDHGSSDGTVKEINTHIQKYGQQFAGIQLLQQENKGFGAGHDRAINSGAAELILVTNLDLEFSAQAICEVVRVALSDKKNEVASWELRQIPYEHPKYYDPVTLETNWSSHACVLIRRSAYLKVGGYDPNIFMYTEDVELSYRFRSYGYVLKYVPRAVVHHFTYEAAGQVKPLQFIGGVTGNVYIRLRYGSRFDKLFGLLLYAVRLVVRSPFPGAEALLLKQIPVIYKNARHFSGGRGPVAVHFPLRNFDYELVRDGAFYSLQGPPVEQPLVTVIMRTYEGRGMFLQQAMQTVFNQTYRNIELIVVEDGGQTQRSVVMSGAAPAGCQVRFIPNPKLGRSSAGNAGMAAATGIYFMFLDDDDLLFADHIEVLVNALMADPTLDAAYALAMEVRTRVNSSKTSYVEASIATPEVLYQEWSYAALQDHNFIPIQAILVKTEVYKMHGGFDIELDQLEDWNLWLRYGQNAHFRFVAKTTSLFRSPDASRIRDQRHHLLHNSYKKAKTKASRSTIK